MLDLIQETTALSEYLFTTGFTPGDYDTKKIDLGCTLRYDWLKMKWPIMSAAMQSVTGSRMAAAMAQLGQLGVIFASQSIEDEARMVRQVRRARAGFATMLETLKPTSTVEDARRISAERGYTVIPVVQGDKDDYGRLEGIIFDHIPSDTSPTTPVSKIMRPFNMISLVEQVRHARLDEEVLDEDLIQMIKRHIPFCSSHDSLEDAAKILNYDTNLQAIPVVTTEGNLTSMVFRKDIAAHKEFPNSLLDPHGKYVTAAAINTTDYKDRVPALVEAGVNVLVIDSSDGLTQYQVDAIEYMRKEHEDIVVIGGNIINAEGFRRLADAGVDAVKVGMGIGSICTTQEVKRTGLGQPEAIRDVAKERADMGSDIPIFCDGSIISPGDMLVAMRLGADGVMVGRYIAGCDETPNPLLDDEGRRVKEYWGEGSARAQEQWRGERYGQKTFEEGVVARVPYAGPLGKVMADTYAKIGASMKSLGIYDIEGLRAAKIRRMSPAAQGISKPHHVDVQR